jgi:hypothetical protein
MTGLIAATEPMFDPIPPEARTARPGTRGPRQIRMFHVPAVVHKYPDYRTAQMAES